MDLLPELLIWFVALFVSFFAGLASARKEPATEILVDPRPPEPAPEPPTPDPKAGLSWKTQRGAFKLTRFMCDEMGLTYTQKNVVCACIYQESQFLNRYANGKPVVNRNIKDGKVWSTDYGIVQVNDYWHIGPGKTFPSVEYVMDNPEEMVRWMVKEMKRTGKLKPWSSYVSGAYKQWLSPNSPMWALQS